MWVALCWPTLRSALTAQTAVVVVKVAVGGGGGGCGRGGGGGAADAAAGTTGSGTAKFGTYSFSGLAAYLLQKPLEAE